MRQRQPRQRPESGPIPVWCWRDAVRQSHVPPLTKLVCLSIAHYLADCGQGAFPSVKTLMADTSMSNKSITVHLKNAEEAGLLSVVRRRSADGRNLGHVYVPKFPANTVIPSEPAIISDHSEEAQVYPVHPADEPHVSRTSGPDVFQGEKPHVRRTPLNTQREISIEEGRANAQPPAPKRVTGTRIADDWTLPIEWREWAQRECPNVPVQLEADKFGDYWKASVGQKATKRDWFATWRLWCRSARPAPASRPGQPTTDKAARLREMRAITGGTP